MKNNYLLILALLSFLVSSCKQAVFLTVNEPPAVNLSNQYKRGGFINRTFPEEGLGRVLEVLDKGLTLEGNLDERGSLAAIQGAHDELSRKSRFEHLVILDSMKVKGGGLNAFPTAIEWSEVDRLCAEQDLDFLIVLEVYDTDTDINYSTGTSTRNTPLGSVNIPTHRATVTTNIRTGWRIYDPAKRLILDEFFVRDRLRNSGGGINPIAAAAALLNRGDAVENTSNRIGHFYGGRVDPQQFRVNRTYFNKGSNNLKIANRRAEVGNWEGAAEMWEKGLNNSKRKVAGRSHHNMAIYYEIIGDVDKALEMSQKAFSDYNIKESQGYSNILLDRINRRERDKILREE